MSGPAEISLIPKKASKICLGTLLGLSVLAVAGRTIVRLQTRRRLYLDDSFLFFGLVCMCTATGLAYSVLDIIYLEQSVIVHPDPQSLPLDLSKVLKSQTIVDVYTGLTWTAEFSVKISMLILFRQLVDRLPRLTAYVNCAMVFTVLVWAFLVCGPFIICPHVGVEAFTKCLGAREDLTVALSIVMMTLDVLTDVIIISIPIALLWKARVNNTEKLCLLLFLTMNVWLIIISVVRISSYKHDQTFDLAWTSFLQYLEPNVAILAACFTAIRSIIVRSRSQAQRVEERPTTNGLRQKFFKQRSLDCQPLNDLPNVPRAAVTGLRTDIWHGHGAGQTDTSTRDATADGHDFGGSISNTKNNIIVVKQDWSLEATKGAYPEHCASNRQFV